MRSRLAATVLVLCLAAVAGTVAEDAKATGPPPDIGYGGQAFWPGTTIPYDQALDMQARGIYSPYWSTQDPPLLRAPGQTLEAFLESKRVALNASTTAKASRIRAGLARIQRAAKGVAKPGKIIRGAGAITYLGLGYELGSGIDRHFHISCAIDGVLGSPCDTAAAPITAIDLVPAGMKYCDGTDTGTCPTTADGWPEGYFGTYTYQDGGPPVTENRILVSDGLSANELLIRSFMEDHDLLPVQHEVSGQTQEAYYYPHGDAGFWTYDDTDDPVTTDSEVADICDDPADCDVNSDFPFDEDLRGATATAIDDPDNADAKAWLGFVAFPDDYPGGDPETEDFAIPYPEAGETFDEYEARLNALPVGTVTRSDLNETTGNPDHGPNSVESSSPAFGTIVAPGTDVTVYANPADWPFGGTAIGGCEPWVSADVDFTPITDIEYGSKFPWGVLAWASTILGTIETSPEAPGWSHPMPQVEGSGVTVPDYAWSLGFLDDYMSVWRTMLSWVMWVGAIWYLGTSLLGFRQAGDPGDAVDDVL